MVAEAECAGVDERRAVADAVARSVVRSGGFRPARVDVVPRGTIPRTLNGKIRHVALRDALVAGQLS